LVFWRNVVYEGVIWNPRWPPSALIAQDIFQLLFQIYYMYTVPQLLKVSLSFKQKFII
jgi:hypothetical protein